MTPLDEARALLTEALSHLDYHRQEHGCMRFDDPSLPSRIRSLLASPPTAGTEEVESRTVEAIANHFEALAASADNNVHPRTARWAAATIRSSAWRPNPESKEG